VEHLWRREEGGPRPGDDLGRLNDLISIQLETSISSHAAAHGDFYLSPVDYGRSNLSLFSRTLPTTDETAAAPSHNPRFSHPNVKLAAKTPCSFPRGCQSRKIGVFFSLGPWRFCFQSRFCFGIFKDCVLTVCDDTHALSSQR